MGMSSLSPGLRELKSSRDPETHALMPCVACPAKSLITEWLVHLVCVSSPALLWCVRETKPAVCSCCCYFGLFAVSCPAHAYLTQSPN